MVDLGVLMPQEVRKKITPIAKVFLMAAVVPSLNFYLVVIREMYLDHNQ